MDHSNRRGGDGSAGPPTGIGKRVWHALVVRTGLVTISAVILILLVAAFGWREHVKGQFGRLKRELKGPTPAIAAPIIPPGGQEPIVLERSTLEGGSIPEFLSATILPGRGLQMLQLKANIPGRGNVNLLASPPLEEAAKLLNVQTDDATGTAGLSMGAALEVPWAGPVYGSAIGGSVVSAPWGGHTLRLPARRSGSVLQAEGGLLLKTASKSSRINVMPDGGETTVAYKPGNFDGRWPSMLDITATTQLSERALDLKITVQNTGDEPTPVGIGWQPRFAISRNDRSKLMLRIPSSTRLEHNARTGEPTGRLLPVAGTGYDFSARTGVALGDADLDDTFVNLRQVSLDNGPVIELRNPSADYGLRITLLSPTIKAIHVKAPRNGDLLSIAPRFNVDDPFGREWTRDTDTGIVTLQPGQSTQWRMKMEIFSLSTSKF